MTSYNEEHRLQCLLAEYATVREEIKAYLDVIHRWMFAFLPFTGALYAFAVKEQNGLLPLFGIGMSVIALFYLRSRMARVIYNASYIQVFIEDEIPWLNWESVHNVTRQGPKKLPVPFRLNFTVLYFNALALCGLVLSLSYWDSSYFGWLFGLCVAIVLVFVHLVASYFYVTVQNVQKRYVRDLRKKKKELAQREKRGVR